ncbi:MAG: crossover junction endodeoxyribonuclease RuvC [Parvularculales bacterium]
MKVRRILGLDPGLRNTGWGVVDVKGNQLIHVANGVIVPDALISVPERLALLAEELEAILDQQHPEEAAVEGLFGNRDIVSSLKLGQACGICLMLPARRQIPVAEYPPNVVKKAVTGSGHARKAQVSLMIRQLMPKSSPQSDHAADALAVAVCHAHNSPIPTPVAGSSAA